MKKITVFLCVLLSSWQLFGMDSAEEMKALNDLGITFEFLEADDRAWDLNEADQDDEHVDSSKNEAEASSRTIEAKEAKIQDSRHENQMLQTEIVDVPRCPENVDPTEFYSAVFQTIMRDADKMACGQSVRYNPAALECLSDRQLDGLKSKFEALKRKINFLSEPAQESKEAKSSVPSPLACLKDEVATMIEFIKDTYSCRKTSAKDSGEKARKKVFARQKSLINEQAFIIEVIKGTNPEDPVYWDLQYKLFVVNAELLGQSGNFRYTGDPMVDLSFHFSLMFSMPFERLIRLRNECNDLTKKIKSLYLAALNLGDGSSAAAFYPIFFKIEILLNDISSFVSKKEVDFRRNQRKQEAEEKAKQAELARQQDLERQRETELKRQKEDERKKQEDSEKTRLTDEEAQQELELQQQYQIFLQQQQHMAAQRAYCYAMPQQQHSVMVAAPYYNSNIVVPQPIRPVMYFNQGMIPNAGRYWTLPFNGAPSHSFVLPFPQ